MADRRADVGMDPADKTAQREMWDGWWYDRFEIPHAIPAEARRLELEMGGEIFGAALLDHVAPKTCQAFWDLLPYAGNMIHCAWFGHGLQAGGDVDAVAVEVAAFHHYVAQVDADAQDGVERVLRPCGTIAFRERSARDCIAAPIRSPSHQLPLPEWVTGLNRSRGSLGRRVGRAVR